MENFILGPVPNLLHPELCKGAIFQQDANVLRNSENIEDKSFYANQFDQISNLSWTFSPDVTAISCNSEETREAFEKHSLGPLGSPKDRFFVKSHHLPVEINRSSPSIQQNLASHSLRFPTLAGNKIYHAIVYSKRLKNSLTFEGELELVTAIDGSLLDTHQTEKLLIY